MKTDLELKLELETSKLSKMTDAVKILSNKIESLTKENKSLKLKLNLESIEKERFKSIVFRPEVPIEDAHDEAIKMNMIVDLKKLF